MGERYSLEKYKGAKDSIGHEKLRLLDEYREARKRWQAFEDTADARTLLNALKTYRSSLRALLPKNWGEHKTLEEQYAQTKEGQLELAHEEAKIFNETFDGRSERLEKAIAERDGSPAAESEYRLALSDFNEFVRDLREDDLERYAQEVHWKKAGVLNYKKGVDADPWYPLSEAREAELQRRLAGMRGGDAALKIFQELQDPNLDVRTFMQTIRDFAHTNGTTEKVEMSYYITKKIGSERVLQLRFNDEGNIALVGRDREYEKQFAPAEGYSGDADSFFGPSIADFF